MDFDFALFTALAPLALLVAGVVAGSKKEARWLVAFDAAAIVGFGVAAAAGIYVAFVGPSATGTMGVGELGLSLRLDALSAILFAMVGLLAIVIVRFSRTYLEGDSRHHIFMRRLAFTIASVELLILAGNLVIFVAAWIATSVMLHRLLLFYSERRGARNAARKRFVVARASELFLIGAAALLYLETGTGDIGAILATADAMSGVGSFGLGAAAVLLGLSAVTTSAQFPLHGWLLEVMDTPTPVSALLHAGILNAGPYLICRFAAVFEVSVSAQAMVIVVGAFTALFASTALLTQPAVKVSLAYSSAAHMGFSLLLCGFGAYAAAVLHLVAHSFYKAHAFLSSGSVVEVARSSGVAGPARHRSPARHLFGLAVALGIYLGVANLLGLNFGNDLGLLVLGAVVVMGISQLLATAFDSSSSPAAMLQSTLLGGVVAAAFFALETMSSLALSAAVPAPRAIGPVQMVLAAVVLVPFAAVTLVQIVRPSSFKTLHRAAWVHVRNGFYVDVLVDRFTGAFSSQRTN